MAVLRASEGDLGGGADGDGTVGVGESGEGGVVVGDALGCGHLGAIGGGVGVAGQGHVVAVVEGGAAGGIDAVVRLHAGDDQAADAARRQLIAERRVGEAVRGRACG